MHDDVAMLLAEAPDPATDMTLEELADFQAIAGHHVTFSMTLACPLRCEHCIVSASPDLGHTTMPVEIAERYAAQMPELAARGIRSLSFTGGEPFLARRQVKLLTDAAAAVGIGCGVVTAGHWGKNRRLADELVASFPGITSWDVSIDAYHLDWVTMETVINAVEAARDAGNRVTIRFSYQDPPSDLDLEILARIRAVKGVQVASQRIRTEGRATDMALEVSTKYSPWVKPCLTQGMVVRYDGSVAPCCLNLVETRKHAFQFGDARTRPLAQVHDDFMSHPLLQLIRTVGFSEIWQWLQEDGLAEELSGPLPDDACDLCSYLMRNPAVVTYLQERSAVPEIEARIGMLVSRLFGEDRMAIRLVERWRADPATRPSGLEGYEDYVDQIAGRERAA
ncbi:radical SAM/SPASM domain-containing protein [Sphingomonas sp. S2-65]|uniref:radical SAM/SPASM domain-containing protein n=1 Tax=Sphingomonas sp. S2-65 TaxID=2903960 RepID=UPI001F16DF50|nr:radical SAM protein [Sphingomonas sp. S2-65]UYY56986.1 radical SAM protein [Sphingomonas sp. S2-65]